MKKTEQQPRPHNESRTYTDEQLQAELALMNSFRINGEYTHESWERYMVAKKAIVMRPRATGGSTEVCVVPALYELARDIEDKALRYARRKEYAQKMRDIELQETADASTT